MNKIKTIIPALILMATGCTVQPPPHQGFIETVLRPVKDTILPDSIVYHPVRIDEYGGLLPWYSANPGESYDHVVNLVWNFWKNMETDSNGMKYYMNHQVWSPNHDKRGIGGDQLNMALSSWDLLYDYSGDPSIVENMKYMADNYLAHSLSSPTAQWPDLPYPYNTVVESGIYDGDMVLGKGYLQPDKAGSFGFELVKLYERTGDEKYLEAAMKIANTLADKVKPGDNNLSPWPFRVNAETGESGGAKGKLKTKYGSGQTGYTSNWTGTLSLFTKLIKLRKGNTAAYQKAFDLALNWLKTYPAKTNKWGPFFEDVGAWSDTQINAITYAMYILEHPELDPDWKETVSHIFQWVHEHMANKEYEKYGVTVTGEQTAYLGPGNSHSSREASVELLYFEKTGDTSFVRNDIRELNWATYMVNNNGQNRYPANDIWMTDGYGDYVRHYLRAMASVPQLAPDNGDHLLRSSSIVKEIHYEPDRIAYTVFDTAANTVFRLTSKPKEIEVNENPLKESSDNQAAGWSWQPLDKGGILKVHSSGGNKIHISK